MTGAKSTIAGSKFPTSEFLLRIEDYNYHPPVIGDIQQFLSQKAPLRNSQRVTLQCIGNGYHIFLDVQKKGPISLKPTVNDIYSSNCPEFVWVITKFKDHYLISNNYFNQYLASINGQIKMVDLPTIHSSDQFPNHLLWNFKKNSNPTYQIQNKKDGSFLFASTKNTHVTTRHQSCYWYIKIQK